MSTNKRRKITIKETSESHSQIMANYEQKSSNVNNKNSKSVTATKSGAL